MDGYKVNQKLKDAIKAFEEYEKEILKGEKSIWDTDINEGIKHLNIKRHVLGSSGDVCPTCNGSGRV